MNFSIMFDSLHLLRINNISCVLVFLSDDNICCIAAVVCNILHMIIIDLGCLSIAKKFFTKVIRPVQHGKYGVLYFGGV